MRNLLTAFILLSGIAPAYQETERETVESTLRSLADPSLRASAEKLANLLTPDFDGDLPPVASAAPWCELSCGGVISVRSVRFLTPDIALAEGASGAPMGRHILAVLTRQEGRWRIAAFRFVVPLPQAASR